MSKIFNAKLYRDELKQLRLSGIVFAFVTLLITFLPPIAAMLSTTERAAGSVYYFYTAMLAPVLFAFMYIGGFFFPYHAFSFVNKRNSSDFYDSLPNSRLCTFTSVGLAALTWIVGIICVNVFAGYALWVWVYGGSLSGAGGVFGTLGFFLLGTVFVAACTMIAMGVTGTAFTNFITTGIILFLPRVLIIFFQQIVMDTARVITVASFGGLVNPANNFSSACLMMPVFGYGFDYVLARPQSYVYTGLLSLIYLCVAAYLFYRRNSENAEKSAPNRFLQHIYRCALTMPFVLILAYVIMAFWENNSVGQNIALILCIGAVAAIVYFVYEAVTTKSGKKLITSIPLFFGIAALAFIFAFGAKNIGMGLMKQIPVAADVQSVSIDDYSYNSQRLSKSTALYDMLTEKIKYSEPEMITDCINGLMSTVDDKTYTQYSTGSSGADYYRVTFYMKDGGVLVRRILLTSAQHESLWKIKSKNSDYINALKAMPDENTIESMYVESSTSSQLDEAEMKAVYSALKEDIVSNDTSFGYILNNRGEVNLVINGSLGSMPYQAIYKICSETPKALAKYMELSDNSKRLADVLNNVENLEADTNKYVTLIISYHDSTIGGQNYDFSTYDGTNTEQIKPVCDILLKGIERKPEAGLTSVSIYAGIESNNDVSEYTYEDGMISLLTDQEIMEIDKMYKALYPKG